MQRHPHRALAHRKFRGRILDRGAVDRDRLQHVTLPRRQRLKLGGNLARWSGLGRCFARQRLGEIVDVDEDAPAAETAPTGEVEAQLKSLPARQRDVLQSIAVDSASIKDTAKKFAMSEGAVRVALHRGLASLTARLRGQ